MALEHLLRSGSHCHSEHQQKRYRNGADGRGDGIENDIRVGAKLVGAKNDNGTDNGKGQEPEKELRKLPLESGADCQAEKLAEGGKRRFSCPFEEGIRSAVLLSSLLPITLESPRDETNFRKHSGSKDDATAAPFCYCCGAEDDIEAIARASVLVKDHGGDLGHWS